MKSKVKDVLINAAAITICVLVRGIMYYPRIYYIHQDDLYGLAVKTILRSSMWSDNKTEALKILLNNGPDCYYHAIISIVNSSMWSSDKLKAIIEETAKFNGDILV